MIIESFCVFMLMLLRDKISYCRRYNLHLSSYALFTFIFITHSETLIPSPVVHCLS